MYLAGMDCACHGLAGLGSTSSDNAGKAVAGAVLSYYTGGAAGGLFGGGGGGGGAGQPGTAAIQNTNANQDTNTNTINPNILTNVSTQVSPVFSQNQGSPGSSVTGGQSMPTDFTPSIVQPIAVTPSMRVDPTQSLMPPQMSQPYPSSAYPQYATPVTGLIPGIDSPTYGQQYPTYAQPVQNNTLLYVALAGLGILAIAKRGRGASAKRRKHRH